MSPYYRKKGYIYIYIYSFSIKENSNEIQSKQELANKSKLKSNTTFRKDKLSFFKYKIKLMQEQNLKPILKKKSSKPIDLFYIDPFG